MLAADICVTTRSFVGAFPVILDRIGGKNETAPAGNRGLTTTTEKESKMAVDHSTESAISRARTVGGDA